MIDHVMNAGINSMMASIAGGGSGGAAGSAAMELVRAFLVGGVICALAQIFLDRTKMMPGRVMVTLVVTGNILGWLGLYEPFLKWAGAGAGVPLLGFGNTLWKGVAKAMDEEGVVGIFKGGLTASSAGIAAALVFGYLASLIFRPKMKE